MSDLPISDLTVDLTRLPAPAFVVPQSFEEIRDARLTELQQRWPAFDALVESDPAIKLIEAGAYREVLVREAVNDAGRATLLAHATDADLDQVAARLGVSRLVVVPATADTPEILEDDERLRDRARLSLERIAAGGLTAGGYRYVALTAAPALVDVGLVKRGAGRIDVVLLGAGGAATPADLDAVTAALHADDVASLTDEIVVRRADIVRYAVAATLRVPPGPDPSVIRRAAEAAIAGYAARRARVGATVFHDMVTAAAAVGGVEQPIVTLRIDGAIVGDIAPGGAGAALVDSITVDVQVVR